MNKQRIQTEIAKLQEKLKLIEAEENKVPTLIIKELKIEVEKNIHDKDKCLKDIIIPKGWRLLKTSEIIFLFNNYKEELNLADAWEFIKQPFKLNNQNGHVARFGAYSDRAGLDCSRNPDNHDAGLGVRFVRDIK
mgnify:CR=1 FL=1